jgi:hypothetical protein
MLSAQNVEISWRIQTRGRSHVAQVLQVALWRQGLKRTSWMRSSAGAQIHCRIS